MSNLKRSLPNLEKYRPSMTEDILRSWASDALFELRDINSDMASKLYLEYRDSMNFEVLQSWSKDVQKELDKQ